MSAGETLSIYVSAFLGALLSLAGCDEIANSDTSSSYSSYGLSFAFPSNWKVVTDGETEQLQYVALQGPGASVFTVQSYSSKQALSLEKYAQVSTEQFSKDMPFGEVVEGSSTSVSTEIESVTYQGIEHRFSINALGDTTPYLSRYYSFSTDERVAFFKYQVELRNDDNLKDVTYSVVSTFQFHLSPES